jgi:hypothetical protein
MHRSARTLSLSKVTLALCVFSARTAYAQTAPTGSATPSTTEPAAAGSAQVGGTLSPSAAGATGTADAPKGDAPPPAADPKSSPLPFDPTGTAGARAAGMAPPGMGQSGNFMDTRLTWTFGDDDFLRKTGELVPLSPTFSVGDRSQYRLFFDNLNSRFAGRENLTHLVMYKKMPSFIEKLTTEAAVVLRFDIGQLSQNSGNLNSAFYDSGSYLRLFYQTGKEREGLSAVFFPLDTDRFRLGYLYDISWGGTAANINQSIFPRLQGSSPGLKVQYDGPGFYLFSGFKTATIIQPQQVLRPGSESEVETVRVGETNFGFLAGGGVDPLPNLRFDVGGGYFQQGKFDLEDVRGKDVYTYGGSGRAILHQNMPVPQSIDFQLYRNDPNAPMTLFRPTKYDPNQFSWSLSAEGALLRQHLKDFDKAGSLKDQSATAVAVQAVVQAGYARFSASGIYRNLNFVVRSVPGFIPFETLPQNSATDPELFGALAADYHFPAARLTPQIGGGMQLPATFRSEFTDGGIPSSRTIVVRSQGDESILPYNQGRSAIYQARLNVRWDMSELLASNVWLQFVRDNNATLVARDPVEGTASLRSFQSPNRLGIGVNLQARF